MCLFTHFAAGALAGGLTGSPGWGVLAGLASHAVLDVLPHYDHPDWRLELGGGLAALALLLFMPFVSGAAVLGGIAGMLPDLENLFQKLGKLRREQFIYPTHTGLLKHGRPLGPRNLAVQAVIFVACFVALGLARPGDAVAADDATSMPPATDEAAVIMDRPVVRVLSATVDRTVVRIDLPVAKAPVDWRGVAVDAIRFALPPALDEKADGVGGDAAVLPPRLQLAVAVPTRRAPTVTVTDVRWWREPDAPVDLAAQLEFGAPAVFRSVPLTGGALPLALEGGVLAGVTLVIDHPRAGAVAGYLERDRKAGGATAADAAPALPLQVLNPELGAALARGGALADRERAAAKAARFDPLTATTHWVRLDVAATGLYHLTGQQLAGFGVPVGDVDPAKLRLYRGGGLALQTDPAFPDSLQTDRSGLNEVAIEVVGGGDGEWNLDDEVRFYGVATSTWRDRLEAGAAPLDHYDHPYAAQAVYWLTWENDATASPLPGSPRRVVALAAPALGGQVVDTCRLRLHREEQNADTPGAVADNWCWTTAIFSSWPGTFTARPPVAGSPTRFIVDLRGDLTDARYSGFVWRGVGWLNGDTAAADTVTFSYFSENDSLRVRLAGESTALAAGVNTLTVANASDLYLGARLPLVVDSFDIVYRTALSLGTGLGQLEFAHWRDQVPAPGTATDFRLAFPDATAPLVWDVSRPDSALVVTGGVASGTVTWGLVREPDEDRHFLASRPADLLTVASGTRVAPEALPALDGAVDYLVVAAAPFLTAGADLAAYRSTALPGVGSPVARAVSVETIYNHYSGGQKDPYAIRNYLRDVWAAGGHRLGFACFLGKASRDYRNYRGRTPLVDIYDLLPTVVRTAFPLYPVPLQTPAPFASDDELVSFDTPPPAVGTLPDFDFPDLACGRLPALNTQQARAMVLRAIAAAAAPPEGDWRNHLVLTADDTARPHANPYDEWTRELAHIVEAENLANNYFPRSLDVLKLYGSAYAFPPGSTAKPALRADIVAALNAGTTMFYYVGHGAEDNLADEQIFRSSDIANLGNGGRRAVFAAFSCDVGVFDSPTRLSMAEQFLGNDAGGGIGAICASQVSWSTENNAIAEAFFGNLFPERHVTGDRTLAQALMLGKAAMGYRFARANSQRYNLMGDPGYRPPHAIDDLAFAAASLDTLRAGSRQTVRLDAGAPVGAGDSYALRVEDSSWARSFLAAPNYTQTFVQPGAPAFAGSGTVGDSDLVVPFRVPAQVRYGDSGRARLIVQTPDGDHAAVQVLPAVRGSIGAVDDVRGPLIRLAFTDGRFRVRPGDPLTAALSDTSGIAILGTSPGNSLLLELDETGRMTDVTSSFAYDPNSYTSGSLLFPLPADLAAGAHRAALHASDALGNVGSDTLSFQIVPAGVAGIEDVTLFPNPTPGPCRLLFELSDPMAVQWDIYTLAGSRLRTLREDFPEAGPRILEWDGRDAQGDEIANGTYLYVLRGTGAAADGREITKTGKLVIMR